MTHNSRSLGNTSYLQEPSRVGDESEREPIDVLEVFEASDGFPVLCIGSTCFCCAGQSQQAHVKASSLGWLLNAVWALLGPRQPTH